MQYETLTQLCDTYAVHVGRSQFTIAARAGVHSHFFSRLREGAGCRVDTFNRVIAWFDQNWPCDLEWPRHIPRPRKGKGEAA